MARKSIHIFRGKVELGFFETDKSVSKIFRLNVRNGIISAEMRLISELRGGSCAGAFTQLIANNQEVCRVEWGFIDTPVKECKANVVGIIGDGDNEVVIRCYKPIGCFLPRTWYITVILTIEYVGKEPEISPPTEKDWKYYVVKYVPWIALALLTGAFIGYTKRRG